MTRNLPWLPLAARGERRIRSAWLARYGAGAGKDKMALLLPEADGVAEYVGQRLPQAEVLRYGAAGRGRLDEVTFYCLPYMGDAASIALIGELPRPGGRAEPEQRGRRGAGVAAAAGDACATGTASATRREPPSSPSR